MSIVYEDLSTSFERLFVTVRNNSQPKSATTDD